MAGEQPPANWYPDPGNPDRERYWDGTQWTDNTRLVDAAPPAAPTQPAWSEPTAPPNQTVAPPPQQWAPAPQPGYVAGPGPQGPPASGGGLSTTATVLIVLGVVAVLFLGGCVALVAWAGTVAEDVATELEAEVAEFESSVAEAQGLDADPPADDGSATDPSDDQLADGAGDGAQDPVAAGDSLPYDTPTELIWDALGDADGSVWETSIGAPRDIGAEVLAANEFNTEPPEGVVFAGFPVSMTLLEAGKEPLSTGFNFNWEILGGATAAVYDITTIETEAVGCGVVDDEFDDFDEVFVGGTLSGTVCIPVPAEDIDHPDTRVALNFGTGRIVFGP